MKRTITGCVLLLLLLLPLTPARSETLLLELHGAIDRFQAVYVQRAVERAQRDEAQFLIVEIDTFGGLVDSALRIASALGSSSVPTVAWIASRPEGTSVSWSAGALIALATNRIYMSPGTSIGAAAPVIMAPGAESTGADEKTVSAIRGQIAALAEKNGHSTVIARAMVDPALEAYLVAVGGEERIVDGDELAALRRGEEEGTEQFSIVRTISEAGALLTLTAGEMLSLGVSSGSPATVEELTTLLGVDSGSVVRITPAPADRIVAVLTGSGFTSLLILIGIVGIFLEVSNPGFGLPGTIALAAFATLFAGNMLLGQVGSIEIVLFMVGLVLLIFEILVIPGFGVAGVTGLGAISLSLILSLQEFVVPEHPWQWELAGQNALVVLGSIALAMVILLVLALIIPTRPFFSRLALANTQDAAQGYSAQPESVGAALLGRHGTVRSDLRPAGTILLDDGLAMPAESEGEYVEKGTPVTIVRVDGNRIVVRRS